MTDQTDKPTREQCIAFLTHVVKACPGEPHYPAILSLLRAQPTAGGSEAREAQINSMLDDLIHCVRSHARNPDKYTADEIMIARRVIKDELLRSPPAALVTGEIEALEAGAGLLLDEANVERRRSGRYDIGGDSFAKHDSRARTAAHQSDLLHSLASRLRADRGEK